jgi:hypothetical protein
VEDGWHKSSGFRSEKRRDIDIRIRDPANPKIPTEVTEVEKSTRERLRVSAHRVSGVGEPRCSILRVAKSR